MRKYVRKQWYPSQSVSASGAWYSYLAPCNKQSRYSLQPRLFFFRTRALEQRVDLIPITHVVDRRALAAATPDCRCRSVIGPNGGRRRGPGHVKEWIGLGGLGAREGNGERAGSESVQSRSLGEPHARCRRWAVGGRGGDNRGDRRWKNFGRSGRNAALDTRTPREFGFGIQSQNEVRGRLDIGRRRGRGRSGKTGHELVPVGRRTIPNAHPGRR